MDEDSRKTIIMMAVCGFCGALLMLARLAMRKVRRQKFNLSDYLTMVALACLASRNAFTTVVVLWGNNNLTAADLTSNTFTAVEIYKREVGSKLTIVNRVNYNT
jgi:H+/Cl- antiporter ClcA